jgi:hypothetical protein
MAPTAIESLLIRWKDDPGGTYRNWFLWADRLKNFRSIRRGLAQVVEEIDAGTFGNVYKGSSLETVVGSIAEQRQIFKGADHAFLWKPKLRIPDIYESRENQLAFSTSIYSGIVRLLDLALGGAASLADSLFLVAPDDRESQVRAQLMRPAFLGVASLNVRYLPYGELERHREQMARFGEGVKAIRAISKALTPVHVV